MGQRSPQLLFEDVIDLVKLVSTTPVIQPKGLSEEALKMRERKMKRRERKKELLLKNFKKRYLSASSDA